MHLLQHRDHACLRGDILVTKFRLEDPSDPLQRALAEHYSPSDDHGGLWLPDGEVEGHNLFLNTGIAEIWKLVLGSSANTFTNAQAQIGIGDSNTGAVAGQSDLQAASNKTYKAMVATWPQQSAQTLVFKSTFGTSDANYAWQEFVVKQNTSGICIDRGVSSMGTKTSAGSWDATVTLSIA